MIRNLYLLRHAKSDWSVSGQKDFDRELNNRGLNDAPRMGRKLYDMEVYPDLLISSPAKRTRLTTDFIVEQIKYDPERVVFNEDIYEASMRTLLSVINNLDDKHHRVMLVGHNPGFTYLAEYLTKQDIGNVPTCGVLNIEFNDLNWKEVSGGTGQLRWFIYPKMVLS